jgi:bile acid:Na+ symporter, BASS family
MAEPLFSLVNIAVLVFSVTSMLSVGFSYTLREIVEPMRNARGVLLALTANFALVPLLAYGVTRLLSLEAPVAIGLLLAATAAGAPFLIKLTQIAEADLAFASGLLVLLLVVTIVYMPIVVPLIAPAAAVSASAIAMPLVLTMLLPLGIGLLVDAWFEPLTERLLPILNKVSSAALVVLLASTVLANYTSLLSALGTGAILAALLVIAGAFAAGHILLARSDPARRNVVALGTAQRNIAAATVVATQSFGDPRTLVMVIITSIVSMALLFPIARIMGKRTSSAVAVRSAAVLRKSPLV